MVNEKEIAVGQNRMYLYEDNIICVTNVGEIDEKTACAIVDADLELMKMIQGKARILIDLNQGGKTSPEARNIFKEISENPSIGKIAYFGLHPVARILASFIMGITQKKDMQFLKTREEALAWLKS